MKTTATIHHLNVEGVETPAFWGKRSNNLQCSPYFRSLRGSSLDTLLNKYYSFLFFNHELICLGSGALQWNVGSVVFEWKGRNPARCEHEWDETPLAERGSRNTNVSNLSGLLPFHPNTRDTRYPKILKS
jgi:hypothetical protein